MNVTSYGYKAISATGNVSKIPCVIGGVLCSSSSSGTITIYDSATTTTTTAVVAVMPLVAGQYYPIGAALTAGCYVVIGGTAAVTVMVA